MKAIIVEPKLKWQERKQAEAKTTRTDEIKKLLKERHIGFPEECVCDISVVKDKDGVCQMYHPRCSGQLCPHNEYVFWSPPTVRFVVPEQEKTQHTQEEKQYHQQQIESLIPPVEDAALHHYSRWLLLLQILDTINSYKSLSVGQWAHNNSNMIDSIFLSISNIARYDYNRYQTYRAFLVRPSEKQSQQLIDHVKQLVGNNR